MTIETAAHLSALIAAAIVGTVAWAAFVRKGA